MISRRSLQGPFAQPPANTGRLVLTTICSLSARFCRSNTRMERLLLLTCLPPIGAILTHPDPPQGSCDISQLLNGTDAAKCAYITDNCGLHIYRWSLWYYCSDQPHHKPWIIACFMAMVLLIFVGFSVLTSNFIYPNLDLLSRYLHISERISGLTLLALGNATPDIFSTYSAMSSNSTSLAVGELIGSANFVICFVVGSMGILKPFEVDHLDFIRDLYFFVGFLLIAIFFMHDERLWRWECALMILCYLAYVIYIVAFTNEKELVLFDEESQDDTSLSRARELEQSSIDIHMLKSRQKIGVFDAQKVWRSLSPANSITSEVPRPSILRAHHSSENTMRKPSYPKFSSSDNVRPFAALQPPRIFIDEIADEDSLGTDNGNEETAFETNLHEPDGVLRASSICTTVSSQAGPGWRFLVEPIVDEPGSILMFVSAPIVVLFSTIIPAFPARLIDDEESHKREVISRKKLFFLQLAVFPFTLEVIVPHLTLLHKSIMSLCLVLLNFPLRHLYQHTIPLVGFMTSILSVVSLSYILIPILKNIGVIFQISESLLGLTILAMGNSTGDLISNLTLAELDLSVIGINACFGAPLLYILFGVGLNGLIINLKSHTSFMKIEMDTHFKLTSAGLIAMLIFYAIAVPCNNWKIDRRIGTVGVTWWLLVTGLNVAFEVMD